MQFPPEKYCPGELAKSAWSIVSRTTSAIFHR